MDRIRMVGVVTATLAMSGWGGAQNQPAQAQNATILVSDAQTPRVFVTDNDFWQVRPDAIEPEPAIMGDGKKDRVGRTAEAVKTFRQKCPQVTVNSRVDASDYVVQLEHEKKAPLKHKDKVAVFARRTGDSIYSNSTLSVGSAVHASCQAIMAHWTSHGQRLAPPDAPPAPPVALEPAWPKMTVMSDPAGADIYVNGSFVGNTPSTVEVVPGDQDVKVSKKGYESWVRTVKVTGGAITLDADLTAETSVPDAGPKAAAPEASPKPADTLGSDPKLTETRGRDSSTTPAENPPSPR